MTCLVMSATLPGSVALAAKPGGSTSCSLVPQLRDVTINQGVGTYARLVRGKEALVRLYLSLPSCAGSGTSIAFTGGSLAVSAGGLTTTHGPFPAPAAPFPLMAPHGSAAALDAPADPKFVVPGSALAPAATTASFTATFSATVSYRSFASRSDTVGTAGTVTFTKFPGSQTTLGATVERRTNALRILAVPMGDAGQSYASQFSTAAQSSLEAGMLTVSRLFPVSDGTGDLAGATGGVRYTILPTLLDIGDLMGSDGLFCGGGSTFDTIKGELGQFLLSWNAANPSATADRVVGVVDESISKGSADACAEGWSAIGTPGSWVRATTSETPSRTGALLAMEIGHSLGLVPTSRDHAFDPFHSPNQEADGGTNRGYDIRSHTFIPDDRTALRSTGTWNNVTTLLEPADYAFLLCALGGSVSTDCSSPNSVGTSTGVGAGAAFVLSGTTDGSPAGTDVVESYFAGNVALTEPPASSEYFLRQLLGSETLREDAVAVETIESLHADGSDHTHESGSAVQLFAAAVAFDERANRIELRRTGVSEALYVRDRTDAPVIEEVEVLAGGQENYTDDGDIDDTWPTVSPDGAWVAWVVQSIEGFARIAVAPIGDSSAATVLDSELSADETQPAWSPDGSTLAYISDGDVVIVAVDTSETPATFGAQTVLYDADPDEGTPPMAAHPTWSPDGDQVAFDADGAIFVVDALEGAGPPEQLTFTGDASHPSWSPDPETNLIAYERFLPEPVGLLDTATYASYVRPSGERAAAPADHGGTHFIVTTDADENDPEEPCIGAPGCSLREAINAANALPGTDAIDFAIGSGVQTIQPTSGLPAIADPVIIDGTTQPGWSGTPIIEIDGSAAGVAVGLQLTAGGSTIRGLVINRFVASETGTAGVGIRIQAGDDNVIDGNYLGTDVTGTLDLGNEAHGLTVGTNGNVITDNIISGNGNEIFGSNGVSLAGSGNTLTGNRIGTGPAGTEVLGNTSAGIEVFTDGHTIGGPTADDANLIRFNEDYGLRITANGNVVENNTISSNGGDAIDLGSGVGNRFTRNSLVANGGLGIDLAPAGVTANDVGDADSGANNLQNHPVLSAASYAGGTTTIEAQLNSAPSADYAVEYFANDACDGGGSGEGARFLASQTVTTNADGFATFTHALTSPDVLPGDFVTSTATDADGSTSELSPCVEVTDAGPETLVVNSAASLGSGGCDETECTLREAILAANVTIGIQETITFAIPGGGVQPIQLETALPPVQSPVTIDATTQPGYDGTPLIELDGSLLSETAYGVAINAASTTVRGLAIHSFPTGGIRIGMAGGLGGSVIEANVIGTDTADSPDLGNGVGILVSESPDNVIRNNIVSNNTQYGIGVFGGTPGPSAITGNVVQGNHVGTDAAGTAVRGNGTDGIVLSDVSGSLVGGTGAGEGNLVVNNGHAGIEVAGTAETRGNAILGNAVSDNGELGIDLGGGGFVAANDFTDEDTGPNDLQNYPTIGVTGNGQTIFGALTSEESEDYRIEFFVSPACDDWSDAEGGANGEGAEYIGFVDVTTSEAGYASISYDSSSRPIELNEHVTATATDAEGNTSEFSTCVQPTAFGSQIWTVDPSAADGSEAGLVADAAEPAFGADGRVAFSRNDSIFSIGADGSGEAQLTNPAEGTYDSMPSLGGVAAFVRFFDNFDGGGQFDVFLLRGQVQVVTTASDDAPDDLRLDLYYECPGSPAYDIAVALPPDSTDVGTASWMTNYDPSLACPDGSLTAIASDGFLRSTAADAGDVESEPQIPVPTIYAPVDGGTFLQYQGISLHGDAKDAEDGQVADLEWLLDGESVGSGGSVDLAPPSGGWELGIHLVTLVATDSDSTSVETSVEITILGDADNDGLPAGVEDDGCFPAGADADPTNAFADYDADGYSNLDDLTTAGGPCVEAEDYPVSATFGPDVLYVPSNGDEVTITVASARRDLKEVAASSVRITEISGADVSISAFRWTVDKRGVATARFDRQTVIQKIVDLDLVGQSISITIAGTSISGGWSFSGTDMFAAKPAN